MDSESTEPQSPSRFRTGVRGLDTVLNGGLFRGRIYLVEGQPGTGKTVLGNQICFNHVARDQRAAYLTVLAEAHGIMLSSLQGFDFYDSEKVGTALQYLSLSAVVTQQGLRGLFEVLRALVREQKVSLIVLDGLTAVERIADSDLSLQRFLAEWQVFASASGCTAILLGQPHESAQREPVKIMVDGIISLEEQCTDSRAVRLLSVGKLRGSTYLSGRHVFSINSKGIALYPRLDSLFAVPSQEIKASNTRLSSGISGLDAMLTGGFLEGSSTTVVGAIGSGKTLLGLHFLGAGAAAGQSSMYYGFDETPSRLMQRAAAVDLGIEAAVEGGRLHALWRSGLDQGEDALAEDLLAKIDEYGVQRLFVDGLDGFLSASVFPANINRFFTALVNELHARNITTLFSVQLRSLFGPEVELPAHAVLPMVENTIFVRSVELRSQLYRLISIFKARATNNDPTIREFLITDAGITVSSSFESAEAILTGVALSAGPRPRGGAGQ